MQLGAGPVGNSVSPPALPGSAATARLPMHRFIGCFLSVLAAVPVGFVTLIVGSIVFALYAEFSR